MAYITPNGIIKVLNNVPLDTTFDHTIYWTGANVATQKQNQYNFFNSKTKYTFTPTTYQRLNRGYIRIEKNANYLYDCNYVMFQNDYFGNNRWFYAFITSVEYINDAVTEIQYEIDVMQTWYFDYELDECFVDREHSASDNLFENIVYEGLEIGDEYISNGVDHFDMNDMYVCVLGSKKCQIIDPTTGTASETNNPGQCINNIYVPTRVGAGIPPDDPTSIDVEVDKYENSDDIVCIYQYPAFMGDSSTTEPVIETKIVSRNTSLGGYVPRNKKLFSSPYNFLLVSNNCGSSASYKWEDFNTMEDSRFEIAGVFVSTPAVICYPYYYRGITRAYDDGLMYNNFPQCAWGSDTFKAWWAQNKASFVTSALTSVISTVMSTAGAIALAPATGGASAAIGLSGMTTAGAAFTGMQAAGGVTSALTSVLGSLAKIEDIKHAPNPMHGQTQTDSLNPGMGRVEFTFYKMSIKSQYARIIDEFFDRFGYATKRNKVPNRYVRKHWTYTKTMGCTITGSIPADHAKAICEIYNNGITFWANGNEVGDYSNPADNTPLVTP